VFGDRAVLSLDADWSLPSLWTLALFAAGAAAW